VCEGGGGEIVCVCVWRKVYIVELLFFVTFMCDLLIFISISFHTHIHTPPPPHTQKKASTQTSSDEVDLVALMSDPSILSGLLESVSQSGSNDSGMPTTMHNDAISTGRKREMRMGECVCVFVHRGWSLCVCV